jgi:hypothetical protein
LKTNQGSAGGLQGQDHAVGAEVVLDLAAEDHLHLGVEVAVVAGADPDHRPRASHVQDPGLRVLMTRTGKIPGQDPGLLTRNIKTMEWLMKVESVNNVGHLYVFAGIFRLVQI